MGKERRHTVPVIAAAFGGHRHKKYFNGLAEYHFALRRHYSTSILGEDVLWNKET
jgi:hypothetical protein